MVRVARVFDRLYCDELINLKVNICTTFGGVFFLDNSILWVN